MAKHLKLTDLHVVGRDVTFTDGANSVTVFAKKLNSLEHEAAMRKGGAARARVMASLSDHDSEEYRALVDEVDELGGPDDLVEYLLAWRMVDRRRVIEAETEGEEDSEWAADGYLQGLRDAWEEGLKERWLETPEDPEAARVFAEMKRFAELVAERVAEESASARRDFTGLSEAELRRQVVEQYVKSRANDAWVTEFERTQIFIGTREPDNHRSRHFGVREEVDDLETPVFRGLNEAYQEMTLGVVAGKGSPLPASSSSPSASADPPETEPSSGPLAATG